MNRINYFNLYETKDIQHEDQLTRAYLVLLRHSFHAFFTFFDYCRIKLKLEKDEEFFSLLDFIDLEWNIETQRNNPQIETEKLVSILITDKNIDNKKVTKSQRNARYDGIITYGKKLTMIIENKPDVNKVWADQLNPSEHNLSEDIVIYKNPIILEWKEIIKHLNLLLQISTITGYEKIMINDFLEYIDSNYPVLNPYDNFSLCKDNEALIYRRIENLLREIVSNNVSVEYHRGWGYYIPVNMDEIKEIGLIFEKEENDWYLVLSLYFGDSQSQSRAFYNSKPNLNNISNNWEILTNFHVSFRSTNLVWFDSNMENEDYINYWIKNLDIIYQRKRADVKEFLKSLSTDGVIIYNNEEKNEMKNNYFNTNMQTLNICPGFGIRFYISSQDAKERDKNGELGKFISEKIDEGLSMINKNGKNILKKAQNGT
jgi:hypothetical protein